MQCFCDMSNALRQFGRCPGESLGDSWQRPLGGRRHSSSHNRQQLARSHSNQWQKMFRSFVFALGFRRKLAKVLHHGVGIDLADRIESGFQLILAFGLVFSFS